MFWRKKNKLNINNIPKHVGIIMDGNSRWAKKRMLPKKAGHREGINRLEDVVNVGLELGIDSITVYAFSTENWKRPKDEVDYIMNAIIEFEEKHIHEIIKRGVRVKVIGDRTNMLTPEVIQAIESMEEKSKDNKKLTFYIGINYGGRDEIVRACNRAVGTAPIITEESINKNLDTEYSSLDLMIRTSGEERISNFLIWQNAYSEFVFVDTLWPDFNEEKFKEAIMEYQQRNRRFGARKDEE